jgi:hypothetical protein
MIADSPVKPTSIRMTTPQSVCTGQGNDLLVRKSHSSKYLSDMVRAQSAVRQTDDQHIYDGQSDSRLTGRLQSLGAPLQLRRYCNPSFRAAMEPEDHPSPRSR